MFKVVIPARYASSRLPGKVLLPLAGKPMLQWVYECACAAQADEVVIATDDERVAAAARAFAKQVIMSEAGHQSGTDRVAEIAARLGWGNGTIVVNAQADEPLLPPQLLQQVAAVLAQHPQADIATLATPIDNLAEFLDPNVVKLVTDERHRALYFSRAPIPWARDGAPAGLRSQTRWQGARRHRGLYAYRVAALRRIASLPPSALETTEKLEQLRALEAGFDIRVADCSVPPGPDVNTSEDYARVSALFAARS
ncbi:MAG TPA: 3-deoxy-manno-octulosonate cytidylyltransferase [Steroidobacteraceae bacterium]|nr:3-deoxy-manno-octulosonate cytidylyltransferase [Steroidobacteraceae bacterium]